MAWVNAIIFIITNIPKIIALVKQLLELFGGKEETKKVLPTILDTDIQKSEAGPLRRILASRRTKGL